MSGGHLATDEQGFYRVAQDDYCVCNTCHQDTANWTIVSGVGEEECGIGQSWGHKETADDTCDLMNMAYDAGQESQIDNKEEAKLVTFFRSPEGDSLGRDGDADCLSPAETAIRAIRELRRQLNNAVNELTARSVNG